GTTVLWWFPPEPPRASPPLEPPAVQPPPPRAFREERNARRLPPLFCRQDSGRSRVLPAKLSVRDGQNRRHHRAGQTWALRSSDVSPVAVPFQEIALRRAH